MNKQVKKANQWLDALIAALAAEKNHESALAALIAEHGGKRTLPLMDALAAGFRVIYPATPGEVKVWAGMPTVSFPQDSAAAKCWARKIAPHLPKLREGSKAKGKKKATDKVAAFARRAQRDFNKAQIKRLIALLGE